MSIWIGRHDNMVALAKCPLGVTVEELRGGRLGEKRRWFREAHLDHQELQRQNQGWHPQG
jgi:hypothetical protein